MRSHYGDYVIIVFSLFSQAMILRALGRRRARLHPGIFFGVLAFLLILLGFSVVGFILDDVISFDSSPLVPAWLRGVSSSAEVLWGVICTVGAAIYAALRWAVRRTTVVESPARRQLLKTAGIAAASIPATVAAFGAIVERTRFEVREVDFPIPGLHPDFEGFRIVQLSDLHVSPYLSVEEAGRAVDLANELKPHLALVTGDLISEAGDPLDETLLELARLQADEGILGCLGNHEVYAQCQNYTAIRGAELGIRFLRGRSSLVRRGNGVLNVAGVDFQSFGARKHYLRGAEELVVSGIPNLLLSHNPDVFPVAVQKGFDAVVGGHTHGGQVNIEILDRDVSFARFYTPFTRGLYRQDGRSLYVTSGIGTIGMPVRLGVPPEVTLLKLTRT